MGRDTGVANNSSSLKVGANYFVTLIQTVTKLTMISKAYKSALGTSEIIIETSDPLSCLSRKKIHHFLNCKIFAYCDSA